MDTVVIVSAVRTPLGQFAGALSSTGAVDLGARVIEESVKRAGIEKSLVSECIMGMVLPCGYGQNPAKLAAVKAGLPWDVASTTVNKVCGSSLKAVMLAAQAILCKDAQVVVAGGMENMSMAPYYMEKARWGYRMGEGRLMDHMIHDGLWDVVNDFHMGMSNELCSEKWGISRQAQDDFAFASYERACRAISQGRFKDEIVPVKILQKNAEPAIFDTDECPRKTDRKMLDHMKPAFKENGVGTAGNSSVIADGASALVLMSEKKAIELGCPILARIGAQASYGIDMKYVLAAPLYAIPRVLKKQGVTISDIDLFEINEAFSGSSVLINRELGLDPEKVNVNGGCVALGHPIGASGARILTTLIYEMEKQKLHTGLVSLCLGGGEAVALVVNR